MDEELDKRLCEKYPKIFVNRHGDMRTTAMCWGFECGAGWYTLLDRACALIQGHIDQRVKSRKNAQEYNHMRRRLLAGDEEPWLEYSKIWSEPHRTGIRDSILSGKPNKVPPLVPQVVAVQVKEKFGTLRFYVDGGDDYTDGVIAMAEALSGRTCEECGAPGTTNSGGWLSTRCSLHRGDFDDN